MNKQNTDEHLYPTRETPVAPGPVSTIQLGNNALLAPDAWSGLEEDHEKFLTIKDIAKGTIYAQVL